MTLIALMLACGQAEAVVIAEKEQSARTQGRDQTITLNGNSPGVFVQRNTPVPSYVPDEVIVKFKDTGPNAVIACAHCLFKQGGLQRATADGSDTVDQVFRRYGVREVHPVFRVESEEPRRGAPLTVEAMKASWKAALISAIAHRNKISTAKAPIKAEVDAAAVMVKAPELFHVYRLRLSADANVLDAVRELSSDPHVVYAQPNYLITAATHRQSLPSADTGRTASYTSSEAWPNGVWPNDPFVYSYGSWGQTYEDLWNLKRIQAQEAWEHSQGEGIVVAVVDTGLDSTHPDMAANVWTNPHDASGDRPDRCDRIANPSIALADDDCNGQVDDVRGWDFVNNDNDPTDDYGHGTHVAGTIAAVGHNGLGIIGVAPRATIMPVKALNAQGSGASDVLARAIVYAAQQGAAVINNSWGCHAPCPSHPVAEDAVRVAYGLGSVVVFAAGNSSDDVANYSPQNMPEALTVSATDALDHVSSFSNTGAGIDVAAPGGESGPGCSDFSTQNILSLRATGTDLYAAGCGASWAGRMVVNDLYYRARGTSMAAPHVAGVAALVRAAHPDFSVEQVRQAIRRGSDDLGDHGVDPQFGYGRLNAAKALAESSPLEVMIAQPLPGTQTLSGIGQVDIRGTVAGPGLTGWRLEFGQGATPTSWTIIASSSAPVVPIVEGLLATWNLQDVPDGRYLLRLTATDAFDRTFEDRQQLTIDQVAIEDPTPFAISFFRAGEPITIRGTAASANFEGYALTIKKSDGTALSHPTIAFPDAHQKSQRVYHDVLGVWDTTGLPTDHYQIILEVSLMNGLSTSKTAQVVVDPSLHPGWPQNLGLMGGVGFHRAILDHLTVADVNGDGGADLLVGYGENVRIYDSTGALLPGWPQTINPDSNGAMIQTSPAVGDLTGDHAPEIVATNNKNQLFVWRADGSLLPGWPKSVGGVRNALSIDNVDGMGGQEIIATDRFGRVKVLTSTDATLPGWPVWLPRQVLLSPAAIGEVDRRQPGKELVVVETSGPATLYLLGSHGAVLWSKTLNPNASTTTSFESYPALGDLDGDGDVEIVTGSGDGWVYALQEDGSDVKGWPQWTQATMVNSPAIGDIDGDEEPEVIVGTDKVTEVDEFGRSMKVNYLFAWHQDGTLLPGWPVRLEQTLSVSWRSAFGFGAPALADVDGDGRADVIVSSDIAADQPFALHAYRYDGTIVAGFPKPTVEIGAHPTNTAAVADLDHDGFLELAWVDTVANLYVWDLPSYEWNPKPWPMFRHDARHTSRH